MMGALIQTLFRIFSWMPALLIKLYWRIRVQILRWMLRMLLPRLRSSMRVVAVQGVNDALKMGPV